MRFFERLSRWFWTVRYLTIGQVWARAERVARRRWWRLIGKRAPEPRDWKLAATQPLWLGLRDLSQSAHPPDVLSGPIRNAEAISQGQFCFLNQSAQFGEQPGWHDKRFSQLWRFHLHYFDYVRDLAIWSAAGHTAKAYQTFRRLATSWIAGNQAIVGDGWHPYTLSLRTVNWLNAIAAFDAELRSDEPFRSQLLGSLYGQVQVLHTGLELDLRGNHLIENIRALLWAGVSFEGDEPQRWFARGMTLLERELAEQIPPDGGHFERCPAYHLVVLKDCLEMAIWLQRNRPPVPAWLDGTALRMLEYLSAILPPDGEVPLLKDSAWDDTLRAQDLLVAGAIYFDRPEFKRAAGARLLSFLLYGSSAWQRAEAWPVNNAPRRSQPLTHSGHFVLRDDPRGDYLILDVGKTCPDYLPGHAHADLLSYELFVGGRRVVVDSGVYEYQAGPWRDYFRSTSAHNTVTVADENQSEVWSSFRVARRARPSHVSWQSADGQIVVQGQHDGYRRLPPRVIHRRTVVWQADAFWLVFDELFGTGKVGAASRVHLHPTFSIEAQDASTFLVSDPGMKLFIAASGHDGYDLTRGQIEPVLQGWYSESFGERTPNSVLTLRRDSLLPIRFGYVISAENPAALQVVDVEFGAQVRVTYQGRDFHLLLPLEGNPAFQSETFQNIR